MPIKREDDHCGRLLAFFVIYKRPLGNNFIRNYSRIASAIGVLPDTRLIAR